MKFGYMSVSKVDQNLAQKKQLGDFGCDQIFLENISGTQRNRPELNRMIEFLRADDTVVVTELARLSRSTKDLMAIMERISQKGAHLKSLKETWLDTTTENGRILLTYLTHITQFESDLNTLKNKEVVDAANRIKKKRKEILSSISTLSTGKQNQILGHLDELISISYDMLFRN
ncbi:MAG: recombinase family protein [Bacillota bacterium]|nr:recombinase family protein [Bacillota bacterium]